jgi:DivIVA domain-containing protein
VGSNAEQAHDDRPSFTVRWRGYERTQVQQWIARLADGSWLGERPEFTIVLRGYDRDEVDRFAGPQPTGATEPGAPEGHAMGAPEFTIVLRGYEQREVDRFVDDAQARIADLEHQVRQLRSTPPS